MSNPAHCLNDWLLPMFNLTTEYMPTDYFVTYAHTIYQKANGLPKVRWCRQISDKLGLVPENYIKLSRKANAYCFGELWVPQVAVWRQMRSKTAKLALRMLQQRLQVAYGFSLLPRELPQPPTQQAPLSTHILFYDRKGSRRKVWTNSAEVKQELEATYHARVNLMQEEWEQMNLTEQIRVYNEAAYIVAPHGAHFANLVFARPNTSIMEIVCATGRTDPLNRILPQGPNASALDEWTNQERTTSMQKWFWRNSQVIGLNHLQYMERDGCREEGVSWDDVTNSLGSQPPAKITTENVTHFVLFVGNRFGLTPRGK